MEFFDTADGSRIAFVNMTALTMTELTLAAPRLLAGTNKTKVVMTASIANANA